jgi:hypothetical protein
VSARTLHRNGSKRACDLDSRCGWRPLESIVATEKLRRALHGLIVTYVTFPRHLLAAASASLEGAFQEPVPDLLEAVTAFRPALGGLHVLLDSQAFNPAEWDASTTPSSPIVAT